MPRPPYLTKSRFALALQCATRLDYLGRPEYLDRSAEDSFLQALAEGGHQVGALAQQMYPEGVRIGGRTHEEQLAQTEAALRADEATLFEAAFLADGCFARVDILRKRGTRVELIEVKAKSYSATEHGNLRGKKGGLSSDFVAYLQDVAFQRHVLRLARPALEVHAYLMLVDKESVATVDGLNQRFRIERRGRSVSVALAPGSEGLSLGAPILRNLAVDDLVDEIVGGRIPVGGEELAFPDAVRRLERAWREDERIAPRLGPACAACSFKADRVPAPGELRSGFHECWTQVLGWSDADFAGGSVLELFRFTGKAQLLAEGRARLSELTEEDVKLEGIEPSLDGISTAQRQWYQARRAWPGGGGWFLHREGMARAMDAWRYPLHFIDFETCAAPIPFVKGARPYRTTAFQFSHHVMHADGRVEHRTQFLDTKPGSSPTLGFLQALRDALQGDNGTVFRWARHENTVLSHLRDELLRSDRAHEHGSLIEFIDSLIVRSEGKQKIVGARAMEDLCDLAQRYYFHPDTKGSSSLKKVLPALMSSSNVLRDLYSRPIYGTQEMPSLNLHEPVAWWQMAEGVVLDPYKLLPPVFADVERADQDALETLDTQLPEELREGGAAMAAYARLQADDLPEHARAAIGEALLRYCELDTLAMVMAVQAWQAELR